MKILLSLIFLTASCFASAQQDYYSIEGKISGFPDGTKVSYFDPSTNSLNPVTEIKSGTFFIKGENLKEPELRYLVFGEKGPAIAILMNNSAVKITGTKNDLNNLTIHGTDIQKDFQEFVKKINPVMTAISTHGMTPENKNDLVKTCSDFVETHHSSYASLFAVGQVLQVAQDAVTAEKLFLQLNSTVTSRELAKALSYQIATEKTTAIGSPIMKFTQNDVNGKPVSISDFRGKYVLIDFWASWCRPCRMENPNVVANYNKFRNKNFTILGVSLDQSRPSWESAIKMDHLDWTQVSDLKGWQNAVSTRFHITSIPQNILVDPNGIIIAKNIRGENLGSTLEAVLGK